VFSGRSACACCLLLLASPDHYYESLLLQNQSIFTCNSFGTTRTVEGQHVHDSGSVSLFAHTNHFFPPIQIVDLIEQMF
jgi:hypothetical protein